MKNKRKSITRRIFALVAVAMIIALSVVPCFATTEFEHSSTNVEVVPIKFVSDYRTFDSDYDYFDYIFDIFLPLGYFNDYSIRNPESPQNVIDITFESGMEYDYYHATETMTVFDFISDVQFFNADYRLSAGNFLIKPFDDEFSFEFICSKNFNYSVSVVYSELSPNSDFEIKTHVIEDHAVAGPSGYSFNFDLAQSLYDVGERFDVFVYGFNVAVSSPMIYDDITYSLTYCESGTLIERNSNGFSIDRDGNISSTETNSMTPIEEFFIDIGINEYKESFDDYTADYTSWIGTAVGGFLNMELFPFFSIGGVLLICVALGLVGYFLKVFMGG